MQIGSSWNFGEEPPGTVSAALRQIINEIEQTSSGRRWQLTWLESLPSLHLDGVEIKLNQDQELEDEEDDSWLSD